MKTYEPDCQQNAAFMYEEEDGGWYDREDVDADKAKDQQRIAELECVLEEMIQIMPEAERKKLTKILGNEKQSR